MVSRPVWFRDFNISARKQQARRHLDEFLLVFEIEEAEVAAVGERLSDVVLDGLHTAAEHHHAPSHVLVLRDDLVVVARHRLHRRRRSRRKRLACYRSIKQSMN